MDGVERTVTDANVSRLMDEQKLNKQVKLGRLLLREEAKFVRDSGRYEVTQLWIDRCDGHIGRHTRDAGQCVRRRWSKDERAIHVMKEIRSTSASFRVTWSLNMNDAAKLAEKV
jgi:hypothetical protein